MATAAEILFPPSARAEQERFGSRSAYARREEHDGFETEISGDVAEFVGAAESFFIATATADGQPYLQHRGGPPGFLKILGPRTLGFADLSGNRQYITLGRLAENPRVCLFIMDYTNLQRVKIWGRAKVIDREAAIAMGLVDGKADKVERGIVIEVDVWDANCSKYIPRLLPASAVERAIAERDERIRELEAELARRPDR